MMVIFAIFAEMKNLMNPTDRELRNESNIFSVDPGINQKRKENCINVRSALFQTFSILFSVDTSIDRKILDLFLII